MGALEIMNNKQGISPFDIFILIVIIALLFVAASGCAFDAQITRRAQIRSRAESKLKLCLWEVGNSTMFRKQCVKESIEFCRANKLEASCGTDGLATDYGTQND